MNNSKQSEQCIWCPQINFTYKNFELSNWLTLESKTSELLSSRQCHLSIIKIDTCNESQIVEMTCLGSVYESFLHLFNRNYATSFLMF